MTCRVLTCKESDVYVALDAALPLCPVAETLRAVRAALAKGLRPHDASALHLEQAVVAATCNWARACPQTQIVCSLTSHSTAEPAPQSSGQLGSLSANTQRFEFACTLLRKLSETAPSSKTVITHRCA